MCAPFHGAVMAMRLRAHHQWFDAIKSGLRIKK
ncbi:hypothetical protein EPYR_01048 [Erwinia pyrifoliae DSM 12163]|nr:hypothetical protein EPYR_01048 [Erwinia pyrifoliae DSM 12163]